MLNAIKTFAGDESGAVTVDWVVLTAALVGLGLAVMGVVSGGIGNVSAAIDTQLRADHINGTNTAFNAGRTGTATTPTTTPTE